ncbi:MAG: DnaB-like helicase C-terminal domain-containing protein [Phycisphaerales bacterium]|nr:MAG: DnaB-like helicase C-terminal domain-containing protein [Phycisphaerales bacterium]
MDQIEGERSGGRPSHGKTSFGLTLCRGVAKDSDGCPVLFVSAEMTARQLEQRLLSIHSRTPVFRIRAGQLEDDEFDSQRHQAVRMAAAGHPMFILDGVNDCRAIASICRRYVRKHDVGLIVVDYLGRLFMPGKHEREDLRIGKIVRLFKDLALETSTAVVLLSQLSRANDKEGREPRLSDLRNSGETEQEADNILLIHPIAHDDVSPSPTGILIAKQRQGSTGRVELGYHKETMSFEGMFIAPVGAEGRS